jgi:hypothetical protein
MKIEKFGSVIWIHFGKILFFIGAGKRFGLGFSINRWSFDVDFLCFYFGVEF